MKNVLFLPMLALVVACSKKDSNPVFNPVQPPAPEFEILAVADGQIHLYDRPLTHRRTLDGIPAGVVRAAISFDHQRIASKVPFNNILISDIEGRTVDIVPNSSNARWFDWHSNNQTLYFLNDQNELCTHGPAVPKAATNLAIVFPQFFEEAEITAAALLPHGDIIICGQYPKNGGFKTEIHRLFASGGEVLSLDISDDYETAPDWIRTDAKGENIFFGSKNKTSVLSLSTFGQKPHPDSPLRAAISPDGLAEIRFTEGLLTVVPSEGQPFETDSVPAKLDALDW